MILSRNEICSLFSGAIRFEEDEQIVMPLRFTREQSRWYRKFPSFENKVVASAGMRMDFSTDAKKITIRYTSFPASSRKICFFDLYLDGVLVQFCGTENREQNPDGILSLKTDGASHRITVYFPNLSGIGIREMELERVSFLTPEKKERKLLVFGDSITQGYDARHPSFSYINRVADHFGLELINKAVGGDTFSPETGQFDEAFVPDHIFVAYGTNDWAIKKKDDFVQDAEGFFQNLRARFPAVPLHVLLPVWRADCAMETSVGTFRQARELLQKICAGFRGVQITDGFGMIPQLGCFFSDNCLHPNDMGFLLMADHVIRELEKTIKKTE